MASHWLTFLTKALTSRSAHTVGQEVPGTWGLPQLGTQAVRALRALLVRNSAWAFPEFG